MRALNYAKNSGNFVGKWNASRSTFVRSDWNVLEHLSRSRSSLIGRTKINRSILTGEFVALYSFRRLQNLFTVWPSSSHLTIRETPYHFVRSGKDDWWGAGRNLPGMNIGPRSALLVILSNEKVDKIFANWEHHCQFKLNCLRTSVTSVTLTFRSFLSIVTQKVKKI